MLIVNLDALYNRSILNIYINERCCLFSAITSDMCGGKCHSSAKLDNKVYNTDGSTTIADVPNQVG